MTGACDTKRRFWVGARLGPRVVVALWDVVPTWFRRESVLHMAWGHDPGLAGAFECCSLEMTKCVWQTVTGRRTGAVEGIQVFLAARRVPGWA